MSFDLERFEAKLEFASRYFENVVAEREAWAEVDALVPELLAAYKDLLKKVVNDPTSPPPSEDLGNTSR